jgi:hypothetical protein
MSPVGRRHETIKSELAQHMSDLALGVFTVAQEPQFNLAPDICVKPDILVHPRAIKNL